jgi:hypothetical protein
VSIDPDFDAELRRVQREHDQMMVEHANGYGNGNGYAAPRDAGLVFRDNDDAMVAAPVTEEPLDFTERQFEALAQVIATLRREWECAIAAATEKLEQKILQVVVRLVQPGEHAEQKLYGMNDRLAILERHVERALTQTKTEDTAVATQRAAEIATLRGENRELKDALRKLDRQHEAMTKELADVKARVAVDAERLAEIKADVKSELQTLDAKQDEVMRLYTEIRLVT